MVHIVNKGNGSERGFKTDPVVFLFSDFLRRLVKVRSALIQPVPAEHSNVSGANAYSMFSRDHFEHILCKVFYDARSSVLTGTGDFPIIWRLKASDRNAFLGEALLFILQPRETYQAAPAQVAANASSVALYRRPTPRWHYKDNFFPSIHGCIKNAACPIFHIMVGRLFVNLVCVALNKGHPASSVKLGDIKRAAVAYHPEDSFSFSYFWQNDKQMHSFMVTCNKIWKMNSCIGMNDDVILKKEKNRNIWDAVLRGVNRTRFLRLVQQTQGIHCTPPALEDTLEYSFLCDEDDPSSVSFNRNLSSFPLGSAITTQGVDFVVTRLFLSTLNSFRHNWVKRRNVLQTFIETPGQQDAVADSLAQCGSHAESNSVPNLMMTLNPN
jgi:hypothetical protein